ncbi:DUF3592 domain-containing protein [Aeromicrobium terrae]|uniref:DUF3592 domain-containing protein n=1 Tax=Aeromicrobium terrae TaxID=2498846 RepID=A0A5C8NJS0_9ACTN|nr:DUF3592 domain-containing protein [Aeromicrobium terrae]TXL62009.1 DUF3592 domain-containing protein [Aeromicrobium terrae]
MQTWQAILLITGVPVGLGLVFWTIATLRTRMTRDWVRTTGLVVDRRTGRADGGMPAIYPTFRWQDGHGNVHQRTSSVRASLGPAPGKQVPVLYDPIEPSRGIIDSYVQSGRIFYLVGGILLGLGLVAGLLATYLAWSI